MLSRPIIYALFSQFFWRVGVVYLVVLACLACVLRMTYKKGRQLFWKSALPRENPRYVYEFMNCPPLEKSC